MHEEPIGQCVARIRAHLVSAEKCHVKVGQHRISAGLLLLALRPRVPSRISHAHPSRHQEVAEDRRRRGSGRRRRAGEGSPQPAGS